MRWLTAAVVLAAGACSTNDGSIQIHSVIDIDKAECTLSPQSEEYQSRGIYDPRGVFMPPGAYMLNLIVENTLSQPAEGSTTTSGSDSGNDAEVVAMDLCWFPAHPGSAGETAYNAYDDGVPENLRCENLPDSQKTTTVLSSPVSAGGKTAVDVPILQPSVLQGLYGAEFLPWRIPNAGGFPIDLGGTIWLYSAGAADPTDLGGRHSAWGSFPPSVSARVIVQARANAVLLSGGTVQSNWFVFPVDICVGCTRQACGLQTLTECVAGDDCAGGVPCPPAGECPDGTYCTGISCPDGSTCPVPRCPGGSPCTPGSWVPLGQFPDLKDTCQPSQDTGPECVEETECPT